jgi:pimeloyl-ACP methyl ester carboxylesterase
MAAVALNFKEHATVLGKRTNLVGIITRPTGAQSDDLPAVVVLNTGIVHRVGHHRMYVTLSRRLASLGHTVVRFDFSGIGDSAARNDGRPPIAACLSEIKEVLDCVAETYRLRRFVLVGLCSGADHAALYGRSDPRVEALVLMDPTLPPTARYYFHYVMQRLLNLRNWLSVATGRSGLFRLATTHLLHRVQPKASGLEQLTLQNLQFSRYLADSYRAVAERGVRILSVFTSVSARHTYQKQMLDAFPETSAGGALRLEYFPDSDHLFSTPHARERLFGLIENWLQAR